MNFWDRLKLAIATFRRLGGVELPDAGRSSDETLGNSVSAFVSQFGSVNPVIDWDMLACLKKLWLYNPDFSQYVANIVNLGNPGHSLQVDAANDSIAESTVARLNEAASRIYPQGMGVDGLINQYLTSIAWSGAISSEDVVDFGGRRVQKVVLVPVEQIRFLYNKETDSYDAYQKSSNWLRRNDGGRAARGPSGVLGLIPLNPETYKYYPIQTVENSPYAKPPATAAVEPIVNMQKPIMENIGFIARKVGLLGLVAVSVAQPNKKPNETESEWQTRCAKYIADVNAALDGNFNKGLVTTFRDQKVEHTSVTGDANGVYDLNRLSEEQVFSGMGAMPGFHGRTDSTTETFADVVYNLLLAQMSNMQRPVKRRMEQTYRLELLLAGVMVEGVSLTFNKAHSRNALQDAQTKRSELDTVIEKVRSGLLSPDEGAHELGYDTWFDPVLLQAGVTLAVPQVEQQSAKMTTVRLSFDKRSQQYKHQPEVIQLASGDDDMRPGQTVVPFIKKKVQASRG